MCWVTDMCGSSSVGRVSAFQADCREFESRLPLIKKTHLLVGLFNYTKSKFLNFYPIDFAIS